MEEFSKIVIGKYDEFEKKLEELKIPDDIYNEICYFLEYEYEKVLNNYGTPSALDDDLELYDALLHRILKSIELYGVEKYTFKSAEEIAKEYDIDISDLTDKDEIFSCIDDFLYDKGDIIYQCMGSDFYCLFFPYNQEGVEKE